VTALTETLHVAQHYATKNIRQPCIINVTRLTIIKATCVKNYLTMKTFLPQRKQTSLVLVAVCMLLTGFNKSFADCRNPDSQSTSLKDSIIVTKGQTNKKYKVKLYPNATSEVLFFSASGEDGKVYQFYLFDMDGKLIKQTQIRNRETTLISKIEKGTYLFEVFSDDERIQNGNLTVK